MTTEPTTRPRPSGPLPPTYDRRPVVSAAPARDVLTRIADAVAAEVLCGEHLASSGIWELRTPTRLVSDDIGRWLALDPPCGSRARLRAGSPAAGGEVRAAARLGGPVLTAGVPARPDGHGTGMPDDADKTTVEMTATDGAANPLQPAQDAQAPVAPVPAPGHADSSAGPGVRSAQGASPEDGIVAGDKDAGSDSSVSSPGAWTALAAPGKPDGEVDTRP